MSIVKNQLFPYICLKLLSLERSTKLQVPHARTSQPVLRKEEGTEKVIVSMPWPSQGSRIIE